MVDFLNVVRPNLKQNAIRKESSSSPTIVTGSVLDSYRYCSSLCKDNNEIKEQLITLSRKNETANDIKSKLTPTFNKGHLINDILALSSDPNRSRKFVACVNAVENARQMQIKEAIKHISKSFGIDTNKINGKKKAISFLRILLSKYNEYKDCDGIALLQIIKNDLHQKISDVKSGRPKALFSDNNYIDFAREVKYENEVSIDMTIHKAKGLEFNNVFVVFENEPTAIEFLLCIDLEQDTPKPKNTEYIM